MIKTKPSAIRSLEENRYYHGVVTKMIGDDKRWQPPLAHKWVKVTFGIESTATLSTKEFEDLMENIRQHCLKYWGLEIPLPNED